MTGCICFPLTRRYDATADPGWWGELHRGEILVLKQDALLNSHLITLKAYKNTDTYDSTKLFGGSVTVDMFKANPGKYWEDLHLLPQGTRLRCVRLERFFEENGSSYALSVEILDEEFKGQVVYLFETTGDARKKGSLRLIPGTFVEPAA